jgi:protein LSM14
MPPVPPGQQQQLPPGSRPALLGTPSTKQRNDEILQAQAAVGSKPSSKSATPAPAGKAPPPPLESKPSVATALAPPKPLSKPSNHSEHSELAAEPVQAPKAAPKGPKSGRIVPAVPIASPNVQVAVKANGYAAALAKKLPAEQKPQAAANAAIDSATHAATAAVAAAMAKLPPAPGQQKGGNAIDNLTQRVNDMRTNDRARHPRGDGTHRGGRGPRGAHRGGERGTSRTVDVPKDDYDFETANARFNKQDLVKEAIASGSPIESSSQGQNGTSTSNASQDGDSVTIPPSSYNKSSSFFDDISSESKDRDEKRPGGREWRGEEQRKNLETFGQGSVDNGYRGGFRGRGRGRGFGRGRGGFGRGGNRGQRGDSPTTAVPSTS